MVAAGLEVFQMSREREDNSPTLWRFLPAEQELPALFMDSDEAFCATKAQSFRRWLASGKKFYWRRTLEGILWPISAHGWGCRGGIPSWGQKLALFNDICNCFGCDELFLKKELYPLLDFDLTFYEKPPFFEFFWVLLLVIFVIFAGFILWWGGRKL